MTNASCYGKWREVFELFAKEQVLDEGENVGAWIEPDSGLPDPSHVGTAVMAAGFILAARDLEIGGDSRSEYYMRALAALEFVRRSRRNTGRLDLIQCNPDSAPDTAFVLQLLAATLLLEERRPLGHPGFVAWETLVLKTLEESAVAIAEGGFHTPNHRWVISSVLALALRFLPQLTDSLQPVLNRYLAEGFDLDPDGFYIERSVGNYDGVNNRSLLLLHICGSNDSALKTVSRNLETGLTLLNADWTAETALSIRFDAGKRLVPLSLVDGLIGAGSLDGNGRFLYAADQIWRAGSVTASVNDLFWAVWAVDYFQPDWNRGLKTEERFWKPFSIHHAARYRYDSLTATFLQRPDFLAIRNGRAEIRSVRFFQAIHGVGHFTPSEAVFSTNHACFSSSGYRNRRPGYEQPLGEPVGWDGWDDALERRSLRQLPPLDVAMDIACDGPRIVIHTTAPSALAGIPSALLLDIPAGTVVSFTGAALRIQAGQELFLEEDEAVLQVGRDALRIGSGNRGLRVWNFRDSGAPTPGHGRLIIPLKTPVDYTFHCEAVRL
jgi:hypothetical protein